MGLGNTGRTRNRQRIGCRHEDATSTITAGIERVVCLSCGHVSIAYHGDTVRLFPTAPPPSVAGDIELEQEMVIDLSDTPVEKKAFRCGRCELDARYYTPLGLACTDHAWDAASGQEVDDDYFWIPLLLDR